MPKAVHNSSKMVRELSETRQKHSKAVQHGSKLYTTAPNGPKRKKKTRVRENEFPSIFENGDGLGGGEGSGGTIFSESLTVGGGLGGTIVKITLEN